jgi:hypothetical protein
MFVKKFSILMVAGVLGLGTTSAFGQVKTIQTSSTTPASTMKGGSVSDVKKTDGSKIGVASKPGVKTVNTKKRKPANVTSRKAVPTSKKSVK